MEAAADPPERVVAVEVDPALPRQRPVQTRCPVKRQLRVVLTQLDPGEFQRLVQLVQPFELLVQLEQAAIPQAVVAFFLVERLQQGLPCTDTPTEIFGGGACRLRNASVR